jgi:hypothetical protein
VLQSAAGLIGSYKPIPVPAASCCNGLLPVRGDRMSDDAKFILGFG